MVADQPKQEDLDWIALRTELDAHLPETTFDKGLRKCKESPLVPIGAAATVAALSYGIWNFSQGRSVMSQYMMRARVVAQAATLVAILVSLNAAATKKQ